MPRTEFTVTIEVMVTAASYEEAMKYALDDLRDPGLFGGWGGRVTRMSNAATKWIEEPKPAREEVA